MKELEHVKAFALAQAGIDTAFKNATNPFMKNKYADLTAIQNAVFPSFHANGFAIIQMGGADEIGKYMETKFIHTSGGEFSGKIYLEWKANDMQSLGAAITYARRYGLSSMSGVPVEDDDGNAASGRVAQVKQEPERPQKAPKAPQDNESRKLTPPSKPRGEFVGRGIKLMKFIEKATASEMDGMKVSAFDLINNLMEDEPEFSKKISDAWELKVMELEGIKA